VNFELTPAQIEIARCVEAPLSAPARIASARCGPRPADDELLQIIAERYRKFEYPPTGDELVPYRATVARRFGGHYRALRLAAKRYLTEEERERFAWRCRHCHRTGFETARGLATHERACSKANGK